MEEFLIKLNINDCQTFLSPILYEADLLWSRHSNYYGIKSASYISKESDFINASEIIKYSVLVENNVELNDDGNLTFKQIVELCNDEDKKRVLHKLFINSLKEYELILNSNNSTLDDEITLISPWTTPTYDFLNLLNQFYDHFS